MQPAFLILENGKAFPGWTPLPIPPHTTGEVVFNTGMTGYPETLTDPSYAGQILAFTYPLIGNYGIPAPSAWESARIHAKGVVVSESCTHWSHYSSLESLTEWLHSQNIALIAGVDTRELTKMLRHQGTMRGIIQTHPRIPDSWPAHSGIPHPVSLVSCKQDTLYGNGKKVVLAVDFGMKENILRCLLQFPITVRRVPYDYDFTKTEYDGIFLSNGPGDPMECTAALPHLATALKNKKPIFGICLGSQLMGLAAGAKTYKLPFGHRGQNQPCIELPSQKCLITSQNHGYAIDERSLPQEWEVSFRNLNDRSVEGIRHKTAPFFSVQFHPEASPGPTDSRWMFEQFYRAL